MKNNIFVRIDRRVSEDIIEEPVFNLHLNYIEELKDNGFLIAGGFEQKDGGMVIFTAASKAEDEKISRNDKKKKKGYYDFDLYNWDIKYISNIEEVLSSG